MPPTRRADAFSECVYRQNGPRRRFVGKREDRRQQILLMVVRAADPFDDELFGRTRLHP